MNRKGQEMYRFCIHFFLMIVVFVQLTWGSSHPERSSLEEWFDLGGKGFSVPSTPFSSSHFYQVEKKETERLITLFKESQQDSIRSTIKALIQGAHKPCFVSFEERTFPEELALCYYKPLTNSQRKCKKIEIFVPQEDQTSRKIAVRSMPMGQSYHLFLKHICFAAEDLINLKKFMSDPTQNKGGFTFIGENTIIEKTEKWEIISLTLVNPEEFYQKATNPSHLMLFKMIQEKDILTLIFGYNELLFEGYNELLFEGYNKPLFAGYNEPLSENDGLENDERGQQRQRSLAMTRQKRWKMPTDVVSHIDDYWGEEYQVLRLQLKKNSGNN
jgi:hypothetical protein